jgi:putative transposase
MKTHIEEQRTQTEVAKPNNRRNGHNKKTIKGEFGEIETSVPHDRESDRRK